MGEVGSAPARERARACTCVLVTEPGSLHIYVNTHARAHTLVCMQDCQIHEREGASARLPMLPVLPEVRLGVLHVRTHARTHTRTHRAARTHGTRSHTHSHTYTGCMDTYNFPPWSIENADAERITRFPYFHEQAGPGRIQDNLDYFTQIEGDDAFWPSQA